MGKPCEFEFLPSKVEMLRRDLDEIVRTPKDRPKVSKIAHMNFVRLNPLIHNPGWVLSGVVGHD